MEKDGHKYIGTDKPAKKDGKIKNQKCWSCWECAEVILYIVIQN